MTEIEVNPAWLIDGEEPDWLKEFRRVQVYIENALEYNVGTATIQDIVDQIARGEMHLWTAENTAIVSQFVDFPRKRSLHLPFVGGNLEDIKKMAPSIINFAKAAKCDMLTTAGRRGWERTFLKDLNFRPVYHVMKMDIDHG